MPLYSSGVEYWRVSCRGHVVTGPLVGVASPWWVRAAAASGFMMTLLDVALSIVPIVPVESRVLFALKISTLVVVTNAIGFGIFRAARSRQRATSIAA